MEDQLRNPAAAYAALNQKGAALLKRFFTALTAILLALCLGACSAKPPTSETPPSVTLPPPSQSYVAPIGDSALEYNGSANFYLPHKNGGRLVSTIQPVTFSASRPQAESIVRTLLSHSGTAVASPMGGNVQLSLYGANPVEVSLDVVTVNLSASALQMNRGDLYQAMQAITNTLTELPGIDYVNFLVVDRAVGLDVANTLPIGALGRSLDDAILSTYEQKLSNRVMVSDDPAHKPLSANVTLYFPLADTPGLIGEVRSMNFPTQNQTEMIVLLLEELSRGPSRHDIRSPALSGFTTLLTEAPTVAYSENLGGNVITLKFSQPLDELLEVSGITRANCMASLCYTMTTFFPGTAGISVFIGDMPVETLMLTESFSSSVLFTDRVMKRSDFAPLLYDLCTLYFPDESMTQLVSTLRPVPYYQRQNPRYILQEIAKGPKNCDSVQGLLSVMPEAAITDPTILGLAKDQGTLLVNFAPDFAAIPEGISPENERMLVYSMVNSLCENGSIQRVAFFISGVQPETFSGEIYWPGLFCPMK